MEIFGHGVISLHGKGDYHLAQIIERDIRIEQWELGEKAIVPISRAIWLESFATNHLLSSAQLVNRLRWVGYQLNSQFFIF